MKNLKFAALFMIVLLINSTIIYGDIFDTIQDPKDKLEETAEALTNYENTDIIINVDNYYPTVLAEQAFESDQPGGYPISATLTGIKTNPLLDLQNIDTIRIRPSGESVKYIRSIYHKKPTKGYFSLDNLGYMVIRLRNLKEDDVPDRLDINMTADISYRIQNGFGVNEQDITLPILTEEEFLQRKTEFSFYGGRGYLRLANIRGDTADLIVYDGDLTKTSFGVRKGSESGEKFLSGGTPYLLFSDEEDFIGRNLRNKYKVRINEISGNKDSVIIEMIFNGEYKQKEFTEGQELYPGSRWKINKITISDAYDEVEFINIDTNEKLIMKGGKYVYNFEKDEGELPGESIPEVPSEVPGGDDVINPGNTEQVNSWIEKYSDKHNIDPNFVKGLYANEGVFKMQWNGFAQKVLDEKLPGWRSKPVTLKNLLEQEKVVRENPYNIETKQIDPKNGKQYTAYGYGQFIRTTAQEKWYLLYGEKSSSSRFYPDKNIELTAYYLKSLGLKKDSSRAQKVSILRSYTGGSGGDKHINNILNSEKEYASGKKFTVGGKEYTQSTPEKLKTVEESKIDEFFEEYRSIHSDFSILIERENVEDTEGLDQTLEDYKIFLNKVNDKGDEKLFNKYRSFVLKDLTDLRAHYAINDEAGDKVIGIITSLNLQLKPNVIETEKSDEAIEGSSDYYFLKAIESYRTAVDEYNGAEYDNENLALNAQLKIAEIYDKNLKDNDNAIEEYTKLITQFEYPEKNIIENRIKFLEIGRGYFSNTLNIAENGNSLSLNLYGAKKAGVDDTVVINVNGVSKTYSLNNDNLADTGWFLKEINENYVRVVRYEKDKDGLNKEADLETLNLGKQESLRISNSKTDTLKLEDVNLDRKAYATILPGKERLTTQTNFMLHIPVEQRLWKLSTEQMNQQINASRNIINSLNRAIATIENIYKIWSISCYTTFAVLWIKNTWLTGEAKTLARKTITDGWKEECENLEQYKGNVVQCITDKRNEIDDDIKEAQDIYDQYKDPAERTKELAKKNFGIERLNEKYNNEALQLLLSDETIKQIGDDKDLNLGEIGKAKLSSYNKIKEDIKNKNDYGFTDEQINKANPISSGTSDSEKIGENEIFELDGNFYRSSNTGTSSQIYFHEGKYYKEFKDGKYSGELELVDEINLGSAPEKAVTLVDSGKWAGYVDKLSIDSVYYLQIPSDGRGGNGIPLRAEIYERKSSFSGEKVVLGSNDADRIAGPFNINDCINVPDRIDQLSNLRVKFGSRLKDACNDLINIDKNLNVKNRKPGEKINNNYVIQYAVQETGGLQCFDIMDVNDCLILFSVCDSVMCPASRFTAGKWKVDNVVSTGIFGSIFLGSGIRTLTPYPNPGICVPGIDASLKNYRSLMEGYEQCLIARRDKGENVGICDAIRSVGICKIAWREGSSFIKMGGGALDSVLGTILPEPKGGGEYAYFQNNIQQTQEFLNFFTKEYATTYFSAYRGASTDEIGEELCERAIYGKVPGVGGFLDQLTKPEGPVQFLGWFTEIPNNDLAGQLVSDYEIYYHIYAGEDREKVRYYVYLKDLDDMSKKLYVTRTTGYLNRGDFVDETVRRTDRTGYDELCIVIDGKENCGFRRISSDLALDYIEDQNLEKSARNENIQTEQECIGESTVFSDPGVESFVDALYPGILNDGLVRVCSAENPGKGVDNTTWVDVGSCGENNLGQKLGKCWLNKQSYKDALSVYDIKRREEAERFFKELGAAELMGDEEVKATIIGLINTRNSLINTDDASTYLLVVNEFNELLGKTISIDLGAKINFEIGETYYGLALYLNRKEIKKNPTVASTENNQNDNVNYNNHGEGLVFEFQDGSFNSNLLYRYNQENGWEWSFADNVWISVSSQNLLGVSDKNINFLRLMDAVKNDYLGGLKLLISRTISNDESGWFGVLQWADIGNAKLVTNNVELNKDGIFVIKEEYFFDKKSIYFRLINDVRNNVIKWEWSFNKNSWVDVIKSFDQNDWKDFSRATEYFSIIEELKKSNDIYSGAIILFNLNS